MEGFVGMLPPKRGLLSPQHGFSAAFVLLLTVAFCHSRPQPLHKHGRTTIEDTLESDNTTFGLPVTRQLWAHAVNNQQKLRETLRQGNRYNAIEADLILGQCTSCEDPNEIMPIMAHPPDTTSDLSLEDFLEEVSVPNPDINGTRVLTRIIKLDFKQMEVVEPTLQMILSKKIVTPSNSINIFFLNADILPGPGNREEGDVTMDPDVFIPLGLGYIQQQIDSTGTTNLAWSLGYKTSYEALDCYRKKDFERMDQVMRFYNLLEDGPGQGVGVVLALNARQLARQLDLVSSNFLHDGIWESTTSSQLQMLAWTGMSELCLGQGTLDKIQAHFRRTQLVERMSYDVDVGRNHIVGLATDFVVLLYGVARALLCI